MTTIILLASMLSIAYCARLDNLYLPPNQAVPSNNYLPPVLKTNNQYLPPIRNQAYSASTNNANNDVAILKFAADNNGEGSYRYNYETANSISAEEQGDVRGDGTKAHGSYSYIAPDGQHISITYTADENGFVAQGSHIPTAPPIPEAILKSLQENAAAEARGIFDDGQYHEAQYSGEEVLQKNGGYKY
ncbi:unnamed protein product [Ceutorhynchus assimilis]|uniref:Uncharacterized protein n=1 Tax=Ceutorhynchus assimilis TaxID=467358 RepID=A0A9N9MX95_9CUCU|nr:unnamed protein product [Ceutorhynchus assimilis]